ncbi:copper chaperone CopZ [Paenibacillus sp. URB8-2]|uniref:copper chaperone CopZ n=1 Tax=Paenibacillus sp. URB8-2 TaxID=2741301 RepID=UPI0015BA0C4F|nr:copper chaperone CopZ [Paenibacillus sp. URB8-2]BCG60397.1 copper chaperone CopZ [Paenibacillus sp. URB8-2]
MANAVLKVDGMSCNHCVHSIDGAVNKLSGIEWVKVNLRDQDVTVEFKESEVTLDQIKDTIEEQGYDVL